MKHTFTRMLMLLVSLSLFTQCYAQETDDDLFLVNVLSEHTGEIDSESQLPLSLFDGETVEIEVLDFQGASYATATLTGDEDGVIFGSVVDYDFGTEMTVLIDAEYEELMVLEENPIEYISTSSSSMTSQRNIVRLLIKIAGKVFKKKPKRLPAGQKPPFKGKPGSTVKGDRQSRTYGKDGYPKTDRDSPHTPKKDDPLHDKDHSHDWEPGGKTRHPGREPKPGDPPKPGDGGNG